MIEPIRISARQVLYMLILVRTVPVLIFNPSIRAGAAQDAWLTELFAIGIQLIMAYFMFKLAYRFPKESLYSYCELILGRYLGKLVNLSYVIFFIVVSATLLNELGQLMVIAFLPETPIIVFVGMAIIATTYAARSGFEVIARLAELLFPLVLAIYLLGVVTSVMDVDLDLIKPVLVQPPYVLARASADSAAGFMYVAAIAVIFPNITNQGGMRRLAFLGLLIIGVINSLITFLVIGTFGPAQAKAISFTGLELFRYVSIADIIERLEPLVMVIGVGTIYLKISIFLYCAAVGIAHVFGLKNYRPLVLPLGTIITGMSIIMFSSFAALTDWLAAGWVVQNYIFELGIFLLILLVALVRNVPDTRRGFHDE